VLDLKILTFRRNGSLELGILVKKKVFSVNDLLKNYLEGTLGMTSEEITKLSNPLTFFKFGDLFLKLVNNALNDAISSIEPVNISTEKDPLEPPIPNPSKIVGIGLNYIDHVKEIGAKMPKEPIPFLKAPSSLIGHNKAIVIPIDIEKIDYEIELVVIVKNKVKFASKKEALNSILGFTIGNDVSARDIQIDKRRPWSWAKSYDTFSPLGPILVTCDEIECEEPDLELITKLNGKIMQKSRTSNMIFKPYELIMFISKIMTLYPGDLIFTGTPAGVGFTRNPPVFLKKKDIIELTAEKIGTLRNFVKKQPKK